MQQFSVKGLYGINEWVVYMRNYFCSLAAIGKVDSSLLQGSTTWDIKVSIVSYSIIWWQLKILHILLCVQVCKYIVHAVCLRVQIVAQLSHQKSHITLTFTTQPW